MNEKQYDYTLKVPVQEVHEYWFKVTASNDDEAIERFKQGMFKVKFSGCSGIWDVGEPILMNKDEIK